MQEVTWNINDFVFPLAQWVTMATHKELNVKEPLLIVQQVTMVTHKELNVKELLLTVYFFRSIKVVEWVDEGFEGQDGYICSIF